MKEKFELYCKVVGLIFFCIGFYYCLGSIPLFFQKAPDVTKFVPQSTLKMLSNTNIAEMKALASYVWQYALTMLILSGIVPIVMGWYLMRSNNVFVRFCYPTTPPTNKDSSQDIDLNVSNNKEQSTTDGEDPDGKYAPPGYLQ
jgi:hypothetical protein